MFRILLLLVVGWLQLFAFTTIDEEPSVFDEPPALETPAVVPEKSLGGDEESIEEQTERMIYLTIEEVPKKIYVGQIFPVTIKITSLDKYRPYIVELKGGKNVSVVRKHDDIPARAINHLTYFFKATGPTIQLPAFIVRYADGNREYRTESITLTAVRLNPPREFSGLLANRMELINYQASSYDENSNILALQLLIEYGNYDDFRLPDSMMQGIDSYEGDLNATTLLYYGVYPLGVEQVVFSYFNLKKNRYEKFHVPIIVKRSSVSTQTNLDPQASEFTKFKIAATVVLILIWLILWLRHRGWGYPILIVLASAYLLTYLIPLKNVCIKAESTVYLLPTEKSTPFMRLYEKTTAKEMNRNASYTKIQLPNNRIGWVKNEDLCSN
ncbi:hypothetical protein [Hydrogenimonas urashimensis]|uniref:hypothetical protein n=1 Tax=Hydrogenimonas urashimensis TaxID=2740515 RepID=UPI00191582B9|nr:hypothetical protein [Hydrogenimonas urashimensis]